VRVCAIYIYIYIYTHTGVLEGKSVIWEVILLVIVRNNLYEHVSNSEWLEPVRFLFVGLAEERSLRQKGGYTRRFAGSYFGCCCPH
jgi:hypothetical protein